MTDLVVGFIAMALAGLIVAAVAARFAYRHTGAARPVAAVIVTFLTLLFALGLHGRLVMAQLLPVSNVVLLGNWIFLGAAALAGLLAGWNPIPWWRRTFFALALLAVAVYALIEPPYDLTILSAVARPIPWPPPFPR